MAEFTGKTGLIWKVELDPVLAMEVQEKHQLNLVNLEADPLLKLRNDPMALVAVVHVLCQAQIEERGLSPLDFSKQLPFPPDAMLSAVESAIVNFFPSGRHSHVREVLASYGSMASKTDELTTAKVRSLMENPRTMEVLSDRADQEIQKAMKETLGIDLQVGTSHTEASGSSS